MSEQRRWYVITGATSGIGLATAQALDATGAPLVLVGRDRGRLEGIRTADGSPLKSGVRYAVGDVGEPATMAEAIAQIPEGDLLAGWVNSAGVNVPGSVIDIDEETLHRGMKSNFEGVFWGCQAATRRLIDQGLGGAIVNLTSTAGYVGYPSNAVYTAAKGAIIALTRQVASDFAAQGIWCNAVAPGVIDTPMNSSILEDNPDREGIEDYWTQLSPVGRIGTADEVAALVVFLLGKQSSFTTGQTFVIDGGQLAIGRLRS